jgi:hypothetical protein
VRLPTNSSQPRRSSSCRRAIRAGCEWKSAIECSRFDEFKDQATGDSFATLIGEPFDQFRGLIRFERARGHGAVTPAGGGLPGRILWKCESEPSSAWRGVTTMPEPSRRIGGGHVGDGGVERVSQTLDGSRRHGSQVDLRPAGLDGREVGGIARRTGSKLVWRKSMKTGMVVPVVTVVIVTTPSRPRTVRRFHLTGASPHARSPTGARA